MVPKVCHACVRALARRSGVAPLHSRGAAGAGAGSERNAIKKKGKKINMVAYIRFDDLENRSKTVDKISHVLCRIQDIHTFDGEPYEIYQVDCIKSDGNTVSFDNVLDIMIE